VRGQRPEDCLIPREYRLSAIPGWQQLPFQTTYVITPLLHDQQRCGRMDIAESIAGYSHDIVRLNYPLKLSGLIGNAK